MLKIRLIRIICLVAAFASVFCLFDGFTSTPVVADTVNDIETLEVETDPMHYRFVGRLYSIILRQDTCDKEEKEKHEKKRMNQMPNQPYMTYMMMYPYGMNNPNDDKPPMMFMIPMYCVDPRSLPHGMPMPAMPPMPNMQFPFFTFPPFGMNMQNK